jgi:thiaminase
MTEPQAMSRDDLFLLLQSYENTVQLNTTLLNQHQKLLDDSKNLLEKHSEIITNLNSLTDKQQRISEILTTIIDKISILSEHHERNIESIEVKIDAHRVETLKDHNQQKTKIMVIGASIGAIGITLLTLIGQMWSKYEILDHIAKSLGVN